MSPSTRLCFQRLMQSSFGTDAKVSDNIWLLYSFCLCTPVFWCSWSMTHFVLCLCVHLLTSFSIKTLSFPLHWHQWWRQLGSDPNVSHLVLLPCLRQQTSKNKQFELHRIWHCTKTPPNAQEHSRWMNVTVTVTCWRKKRLQWERRSHKVSLIDNRCSMYWQCLQIRWCICHIFLRFYFFWLHFNQTSCI